MTRPGFAFREVMTGSLTPTGGGAEVDLTVSLAIEIEDLDAFLVDQSHRAGMTGEISSRTLGGRFTVETAAIELFPVDGGDRGAEMRYRIAFTDGRRTPMAIHGVKTLRRGRVAGVWGDVTVMATKLFVGVEPRADAAPIASGTIRITPLAVAREMTTVRGRGSSPGARIAAVVRFAAFFGSSVLSAYRPRRQEPTRP
jgi:cholesterol oxidase